MAEKDAERETLLKRIRALQEKTVANGCTEEEAYAAAMHAAKLLDQYGFSQDEVEFKNEPLSDATFISHNKQLLGARYVAVHVEAYCDVRIVQNAARWPGKAEERSLKILGRESDTAVAIYLLHLFHSAFWNAWRVYQKEHPGIGQDRQYEKYRQSFEAGMASRLGQRLAEMKLARAAEMDPNSTRTGKDLVLVKNAIVSEEFAKRYPSVRKGRAARATLHADVFMAGSAAAESVAIQQGMEHKTTKALV